MLITELLPYFECLFKCDFRNSLFGKTLKNDKITL